MNLALSEEHLGPQVESSPIDFAAVPDADDKDGELLAHCLIDNAVTSNTEPAEAGKLSLESAPCKGLVAETVDRLDQPSPIVFGDPAQCLRSTVLNLDRVAHAGLPPSPGEDRPGLGAAPGPGGGLRGR